MVREVAIRTHVILSCLSNWGYVGTTRRLRYIRRKARNVVVTITGGLFGAARHPAGDSLVRCGVWSLLRNAGPTNTLFNILHFRRGDAGPTNTLCTISHFREEMPGPQPHYVTILHFRRRWRIHNHDTNRRCGVSKE